jgi:hypothetical protein
VEAARRVGLLHASGCTSDAHEAALLYGEDLSVRADYAHIDSGSQREILAFLVRRLGGGSPLPRRAAAVLRGLPRARERAKEALGGHCEVAARLASRLGCGRDVPLALEFVFERWDGGGLPAGAKGEAIPLTARLLHVARDRSPGGSSSGSAAAVADGLVAGATATDGGGSIRIPASMWGLVGLKPSRGLVPLAPLAEHWHGLTSAGVLTRTVEDTARLLDVIAGPPAAGGLADAASGEPDRLRIGVSVVTALKPARADRAARDAVAGAADALRELGHEVVEVRPRYGVPLRDLLPVYLNGIAEEADSLPPGLALESRSRRVVRAGRRYGEGAVARSRRNAEAAYERMFGSWNGADLLLTPTVAAAAPPRDALLRRGALATFLAVNPWATYTMFWNWTGQPALSLPGARDKDGLPRGVQVIGRPAPTRCCSRWARSSSAPGHGQTNDPSADGSRSGRRLPK